MPDPSGEHQLWLYTSFGPIDELQRQVLRPEQLSHRANILLGLDRPAEVLSDERAGQFEQERARLALGALEACLAGSYRTVVASATRLRGRGTEVESRWPSDWKILALAQGASASELGAGGIAGGIKYVFTIAYDLSPLCLE